MELSSFCKGWSSVCILSDIICLMFWLTVWCRNCFICLSCMVVGVACCDCGSLCVLADACVGLLFVAVLVMLFVDC